MSKISELIQALSVFSASWAIIAGIDAWKREFIGKRRIEVAEATLEKFYAVIDAIAFMRNAFSHAGEGKTRQRAPHEREQESALLDRGYIIYERYGQKKEIFAEFLTSKYRFMACFGKDSEELFNRTNQTVNKIFSAANVLSTHYWPRQGRPHRTDEEFKKHLDQMFKYEAIFWDGYSEDDVIRKELSEILEKFETITAPCFQEKTTIYHALTSNMKNWFSRKKSS